MTWLLAQLAPPGSRNTSKYVDSLCSDCLSPSNLHNPYLPPTPCKAYKIYHQIQHYLFHGVGLSEQRVSNTCLYFQFLPPCAYIQYKTSTLVKTDVKCQGVVPKEYSCLPVKCANSSSGLCYCSSYVLELILPREPYVMDNTDQFDRQIIYPL